MIYLGQKSKTPSESYRLENKQRGYMKYRNYTEVVYIIGDSLSDTVDMVRADANLPQLGDEYGGAYCVGISPKEAATIINPTTGQACSLWEVTVEWDSDVGTDINPGMGAELADERPPVYRWTSEQFEEILEKDVNGNPICTPTGEKIVCMVPRLHPILEIHRNQKFPFEPTVILNYSYHKNQSLFWGAPPGTALMLPMEVDFPITEDGIVYVPVTYRIRFNPRTISGVQVQDTLNFKPMCKGLYYYDDAEYAAWVAGGSVAADKPLARLYATQNSDWNAKEVYLDPFTGQKAQDQVNPEYLDFEIYPDAEFNDLNLQPWWWSSTTTSTTTTT